MTIYKSDRRHFYVYIYIFFYFYIFYDKVVDIIHMLHNAQLWQVSNYYVFFCKFHVIYDLADYQQLLLDIRALFK